MANQTIQSTKKLLSVHDFVPDPEQVNAFKEAVFGKVDKGMDYLIFVQFMIGIVIAFYTQTWYTAIGMGVISLAIYCTFRFLFTGLAILRYLVSGLLGIFIIQYLLQLHGLMFVQRLFSLSLTILLFYQNWRLLIPNFVVTLVYMLACVYIIENPDSSFQSFFVDLANYDTTRIVSFFAIHIVQFVLSIIIALQLERRFASGVRNIIYINEQLNLEANIQLANQIANGNFDAEYETKKNDYMGETLLSMRENLKNYREQEDRNHWINEGIARVSQVLMQHNDLETLSYQTLNNVIKYTKSSQGLIYHVVQDIKTETQYLNLLACYAYEHQEKLGKNFDIGEDLVGEVVLRKKTIHIKELPENYLSIASGLGGAMPKELVLVPLKVKDEVIGVLELGTFTTFQTRHIEFLEKIGERIATSLLSVQASQRNNDLLKEARVLAEQLQSQEEFLKQNMEELQSTQTAISEANDKLSSLLINVQGMIFTQKKEGLNWTINFVSEGAKTLTGYEPKQIMSGEIHFSDMIHPDDLKTTYQDAEKIVSQAIADKTIYEISYRILDADKNVKYVWEKGNGLYDNKGKLIGLQGFVTDITAQISANQQMQEQLEEMQAQEQVINQTFEQMQTLQQQAEDNNIELQNTLKAIDEVLVILELNPDRTVKYVNQKFCEVSQYLPEEIVGKDLAFYVLEEDLLTMDSLWINLLKGNPTMKEIRRIRKDKQLFWLQAYYIPTIDVKGNLVKITTMSTDITEQKNKQKELELLVADIKK